MRNRSLVLYLMILSVVAGLFAFVDLGRNEDPPFTIRTMVVPAVWPGATLDETLQQVAERIERKLQETDGVDVLRCDTRPRRHHHLRRPPRQRARRRGAGRLAAGPQRRRRHPAHHAAGCPAAPSSTTGSATSSASSTASPPTGSPIASSATTSTTAALELLPRSPDARRSRSWARRTSRSSSSSRGRGSRRWGSTTADLRRPRGAERGAPGRRRSTPGGEPHRCGSPAPSRPSTTFSRSPSIAGRPGDPARRHRRGAARLRRSAAAAAARSTASRRSGSPFPCARAATSSRWATTSPRRWRGIVADLPIGIEPHLVSDQPEVVRPPSATSSPALYQAIAIILVMSFLSLGGGPGRSWPWPSR